MELDLYHVDAFTSEVFKGNPACVMLMTDWPSDQTLRSIAQEKCGCRNRLFDPPGVQCLRLEMVYT